MQAGDDRNRPLLDRCAWGSLEAGEVADGLAERAVPSSNARSAAVAGSSVAVNPSPSSSLNSISSVDHSPSSKAIRCSSREPR